MSKKKQAREIRVTKKNARKVVGAARAGSETAGLVYGAPPPRFAFAVIRMCETGPLYVTVMMEGADGMPPMFRVKGDPDAFVEMCNRMAGASDELARELAEARGIDIIQS
jgi:hypothetical protein